MSNRTLLEQRSLEEVKLALIDRESLATEFAHRIDDVRLDGSYPATAIIVTGQHTYDGSPWTVRFPIWDNTGGTRAGQPMPRFIGALVLAEVLEA